jgi:hypothetical protein
MNTVSLDQLSFDDFSRLLRTKFQVWLAPDDAIELELIEATLPLITATGADHLRFENFSLLFLGPAGRLLAQRIYTFENSRVGRFDLFIVPVGCEPDGVRYQAAFSRRVASG